ncbi:MAG: WG repeat-containing protein [Candidatus Hermodarchaeota archaeon]
MSWKELRVSEDGTHHTLAGKPAYSKRFITVLKFHKPGLAPAEDHTGSFHILPDGTPAYEERFLRTFGFYFDRAAVITKNGWTHINPQGTIIYPARYDWVGNFQDKVCTVRLKDQYFHIDQNGKLLYPEKYLYAGDFRNGIAVIRKQNGKTAHIYKDGSFVHGKKFIDLDVYHKGFARARDNEGWFHIDLQGESLYKERFLMIEPFYNGFALVHRFDGEVGIINEQGDWIHSILKQK